VGHAFQTTDTINYVIVEHSRRKTHRWIVSGWSGIVSGHCRPTLASLHEGRELELKGPG